MSRFFAMPFATVYPLYRTKVERTGRMSQELDEGKAIGKILRERDGSGKVPG